MEPPGWLPSGILLLNVLMENADCIYFKICELCYRLASLLGEYIHKRTLWPTRPFGTIVHILGHDRVTGAKVIEIDPLGNCYDCRFTSVGRKSVISSSLSSNLCQYLYFCVWLSHYKDHLLKRYSKVGTSKKIPRH